MEEDRGVEDRSSLDAGSILKLSSDIDSIIVLTKQIVNLVEANKPILVALGGSLVFSLKIGDAVDLTTIMGERCHVMNNLDLLTNQVAEEG